MSEAPDGLSFEEFKLLAKNPQLSQYEKIGFGNKYREGFADSIWKDIGCKLSNISISKSRFLDVGSGCSDLTHLIINHCLRNQLQLTLIDSQEMLELVPNHASIKKVFGEFPHAMNSSLDSLGKFDIIMAYSVIQYVFSGANFYDFIDSLLLLLAPKGQLLLGDIPNSTVRKRFLSSDSGVRYHSALTGDQSPPEVAFNQLDKNQIDDAIVLSIIARARLSGFHAYILPQSQDLPMANRREDVLIIRP